MDPVGDFLETLNRFFGVHQAAPFVGRDQHFLEQMT